MSEIRRLVIDIGTNSVLALLAIVDGERLSVIFDNKKTTKLGEGLIATGRLSEAAISRTVGAISNFSKLDQYDEIFLVGTEALRIAKNSGDFSKALKNEIGLESTIIKGIKEAELSFLGSLYNLNIDKSDILLIDVGGGSSEMVKGENARMTQSLSIPIGALKLKEMSDSDSIDKYINLAKTIIKDKIDDVHINESATVLGTGGTIASTAAIAGGLLDFNATRIHGSILTTTQLTKITMDFQNASAQQRESLIPFDPERADIMLPGLGIYLAILGIIDKDSLVVSTGGLRYGAALYPDKIWA